MSLTSHGWAWFIYDNIIYIYILYIYISYVFMVMIWVVYYRFLIPPKNIVFCYLEMNMDKFVLFLFYILPTSFSFQIGRNWPS